MNLHREVEVEAGTVVAGVDATEIVIVIVIETTVNKKKLSRAMRWMTI